MKNSNTHIKYGRIFSILTSLLGIILVTYMIKVEGEPGALPLLLIITGIAGFIICQTKLEKQGKLAFTISKNQRLIAGLTTIVILLLVPLIAMQFSTEFDWDIYDFTLLGVLLFSTGAICEFLVLRKIKSIKVRIFICGTILFVLFLIWAELAVGIFGSPFAGS